VIADGTERAQPFSRPRRPAKRPRSQSGRPVHEYIEDLGKREKLVAYFRNHVAALETLIWWVCSGSFPV